MSPNQLILANMTHTQNLPQLTANQIAAQQGLKSAINPMTSLSATNPASFTFPNAALGHMLQQPGHNNTLSYYPNPYPPAINNFLMPGHNSANFVPQSYASNASNAAAMMPAAPFWNQPAYNY